MKGLDTNVLIRYLVEDDPGQTRQATRIIEDARQREEELFVSLLVLCEAVWVLDRRYGHTRAAIAAGLEQLLDTGAFLVERADLARTCVARFREGRASLADYVIGAIAEEAGCDRTFTFDRDLRGCPGFQVL